MRVCRLTDMDLFDQKQILTTISIIVDTREQPTKRAERRYTSFGVPYQRAVLDYGDYTYNAIMPDGTPLYDVNQRVIPHFVIERKESLDELAQCFTRDRERFKREFERAKEHGARIVLIVENASFENLINGRYRSKFHPKAFLASVMAYMVRYNMGLLFCKEETSGTLIAELLYRDLSERLANGDINVAIQ